jgi:hypothetical protein
VHALEPGTEYAPAEQLKQAEEPVLDAKRPAAQLPHEVDDAPE